MSNQGLPCWFELASNDQAAAQNLYSAVLGWNWKDAGVEGMTYFLAMADDAMVAGLASLDDPDQPPGWTLYIAVDDCDATASQAQGLGAKMVMPPMDIPGTGRFAILADPQGANFGLLQPLPGGTGGAFDPAKPGHGSWVDLGCPKPEAAAAFYGALFGWTLIRSLPMGPDKVYRSFNHAGQDIGGFFESADQTPAWTLYFNLASARSAAETVARCGGTVLHAPTTLPSGANTLRCTDAQGARFALVGPA